MSIQEAGSGTSREEAGRAARATLVHLPAVFLLTAAVAVALFAVASGNGATITWISAVLVVALAGLGMLLYERERTARPAAAAALPDLGRELVIRLQPDGRVAHVSPSAQRLLGREPDEVSSALWDVVHPDDRGRVEKAIKALAAGASEEDTLRFRALHRDGRTLWLDVATQRTGPRDRGGATDIVLYAVEATERLRELDRLARSEWQLRSIIDHLPINVTYIDAQQRYVFVNAHMAAVFGIDPESSIGRTILDVRGAKTYARIRPYVEAALGGRRVQFELEVEEIARSVHYESTYIPDFAADGSVAGFYVVSQDISELVAARRQLEQLGARDPGTGLASRRVFERELGARLASGRPGLALLHIDVARPGQPPVDDATLRQLAAIMIDCLDASDFAARLGDAELGIVIAHGDTRRVGKVVAGKILAAVNGAAADAGVALSIGIGIASAGDDVEALRARAGAALVAAIEAGRNTFRVAQANA